MSMRSDLPIPIYVLTKKVNSYLVWKDFSLKWNRHVPSGIKNLRTVRLIPCECLTYRKLEFSPNNEHLPRISPHPQASEIPTWTPAETSQLLVFLVHKYSLTQTFKGLTCGLHSLFPKLQFIFYSWLNFLVIQTWLSLPLYLGWCYIILPPLEPTDFTGLEITWGLISLILLWKRWIERFWP